MLYSCHSRVRQLGVTVCPQKPPRDREKFCRIRDLRGWQKRFQPPQPQQISHLFRWLFSLFYKAFRPVRVSQIKNSLSPPFTRTSYSKFPYFSSIYAILVPKYAIIGLRENLHFISLRKRSLSLN